MSGGGGKGGSQKSTTEVKLPKWMEDAFQQALSMSGAKAQMGYVPYTGPEVAAFNPMQVNSMQQGADIASMFGMGPQMDVNSMIPQSQDFAGGIKGYSSLPLFEESKATLGTKYPGLKSYLDSFFIDPVSGQMAEDNPWTRAAASLNPPNGGASNEVDPNKRRNNEVREMGNRYTW